MSKKGFIRRHAREIAIDLLIGLFALGFILAGVILLFVSTLQMPDLSSFAQRRVEQSTKIYDRTGEILLYDLHQDVRRTIVPYENISRHIKNATVAIEDDTFFEHHGVRPLSIVRAAIANLTGGDIRGQGGSTITQQVIKNSVLAREKTITRKIKEAILAIKLENQLSKEEILGHYLNESPYGGTIYGVEEASQAYFAKHAGDITLAEAAYLAALPQAPTFYSPFGQNKSALENRKTLVLSQMRKHDFITEEEFQTAKNETVTWKTQSATGIRAPHFVFYLRDYLAQKYGEEALTAQGFKIISTIDYPLQEKAEAVAKKWAAKNKVAFDAENAAIVATDPKTGQILTMVGSRDYFDTEIDGNYNIALAERQPGSSFKPFVYAAAFAKGYTPETVVFDLKTQFSTSCKKENLETEDTCYAPTNYDNKFRGPMTFRSALAQSINVPAVKALYLVGVNNAIKFARDLGISTLGTKGQYGLTLVLGGGEVKLLDMVGAYGVFANEGKKHDLTGILRIEDASGKIIESFSDTEGTQIIDKQVALQISDVLSDNNARAPSYGWNSPLYFNGKDVAAKTGTTNDYRDTWIVGYSPTIAVGAWAGNNDNSSMAHQVAGFIVSPMWREFMDFALGTRPDEKFTTPDPLPSNLKPILRGSWVGAGALNDTGSSTSISDALSDTHDILHYVVRDNPRGPSPSNPWSDSQYAYWEYPVTLWKNSLISFTASSTEPEKSTDETGNKNNDRQNRSTRKNRTNN